jgi:hypothetical protein
MMPSVAFECHRLVRIGGDKNPSRQPLLDANNKEKNRQRKPGRQVVWRSNLEDRLVGYENRSAEQAKAGKYAGERVDFAMAVGGSASAGLSENW